MPAPFFSVSTGLPCASVKVRCHGSRSTCDTSGPAVTAYAAAGVRRDRTAAMRAARTEAKIRLVVLRERRSRLLDRQAARHAREQLHARRLRAQERGREHA